jgi:hypothetical protein
MRVVVDTLGRQGQELADYARSLDTRAALCLGSGEWRILNQDGTSHQMTSVQIIEEIGTW